MRPRNESGDFPLCYGCGQENPVGFKLKVRREGDRAVTEFTPGDYHTGWPRVVHGGVLCVLMDEVMNYLPYFSDQKALTGKIEMRFRRPAYVGETLLISAQITRQKSRTVTARGVITLKDGTTVAESESLIFLMKNKEG